MMRTVILLFLLLSTSLYSQTPGTSTLLSVNEGLSQGMVFDVLQSRDGYLWIATKDGLNRYDGYRFEVFSPNAFDPFSVGASEIRKLYEDPRGWLWLCYNGGIDFFFPETGHSCHLPLHVDQNFDGYVHSFALLPDGAVWLECRGLLWKIEATPDILQKAIANGQAFPDIKYTVLDAPSVGAPPGFQFNTVFFTKNQQLFAGTSDGIYRIEQQGRTYRLLPEALPGLPVFLLGEDKTGWLWLRTNDALWVQKNMEKPFEKVHLSASNGWWFDREGHLWNRQGSLLWKWMPANLAAGGTPSLQISISGPAKESISYYFTVSELDHSGNVWVGTSGYGLLKINPATSKFNSYLPLTSQQMVYEDPAGGIFTVREPRVLFPARQFDRPLPNPWLEKVPPGKEIISVAFDKKENCWVKCTGGELYRIDARTRERVLYALPGTGLLCTASGKLMSATADALHVFDPETEKTTSYPFDATLKFNYDPNSRLNFFYEDSGGSTWIYAFEGLLKAAPAAGGYQFEHLKNDPANRSSLSSNFVLSVAEDPLEPLRYRWVGTKGGGLNRLDLATGAFKHFTTEQGLPDNVVYGILAENTAASGKPGGYLWLSTNKGLCRFHVREETVKNFTAADGLQDNEFNTSSYLKTRDGTMIFGGVNGLTVFHPDSLRYNERRPRTVLTRLWVNNEPVHFGQTPAAGEGSVFLKKTSGQHYRIGLSHKQNLVTIEFAALEFTNPAQNQYRYQLLRRHTFGRDEGEGWVELGARNSIQFANLRPGSYTFSVLGSNNDGTWGEQPAVLAFTIRPPWWATGWAISVYFLVAVAGVWLFYKYQLRQRLAHQEALRLQELDEFKNRLFTNITHEFRTPLTVILGMAEQLESKVDAELKSKAGLVRRNGQNLLRLINQILDLAKLESKTLKLNYVQGDVLPYLRYITESLHSLANAQNVMLRVESKEPEIIMDYDPERLLQIIHNLLSNAIKFTPSGGRVTLSAGMRDEESGMRDEESGMRDEGRGMIRPVGSSLIPHPSSLVIYVSDTGAGIPPEDLPYIFDRFYQANNLEKAKAGGTGIGLALTKELVKAMGGDISVQSEVGKGTTFTVRLPVIQSPPEKSGQALTPKGEPLIANPAEISEKITSELPGMNSPLGVRGESRDSNHPAIQPSNHILLIEDNPDVVEYLADCLGGFGNPPYQLDFAYNGRAGIEKALETIPDLIISDVMMPEKDGFEVCETLKNDERTSHIPIVLLTAKADVENRIAGLKRGADAYLAKPFHREELLVTLENLLEMRRKLQAKYGKLEIGNSAIGKQAVEAPSPLTPHPSSFENAFLQKFRAVVEQHLSEPELDMQHLERALAMSRSQIFRKMKALTGKSPSQFVRSIRLHHGRRLLQNHDLNVTEIAYEVGFSSVKYFSDAFLEEFGERPTQVRG